MALMLAMAEASCAGICDLVIFGMVNAAMIRMIVTTISNSISVKPRSRLRLNMFWGLIWVFAQLIHSNDAGQLGSFPRGNRKLLSTAALMSKQYHGHPPNLVGESNLLWSSLQTALELFVLGVSLPVNTVFVPFQTKAADSPNSHVLRRLPYRVDSAWPALTKALETHAVTPLASSHSLFSMCLQDTPPSIVFAADCETDDTRPDTSLACHHVSITYR